VPLQVGSAALLPHLLGVCVGDGAHDACAVCMMSGCGRQLPQEPLVQNRTDGCRRRDEEVRSDDEQVRSETGLTQTNRKEMFGRSKSERRPNISIPTSKLEQRAGLLQKRFV
jgi:hypothetical protein